MTEIDRLAEMLALQLDLQKRAYGRDITNMPAADRVTFVKNMVLALTDELHEALQETTWKPWTSDVPTVHEDAFFSELVDAWHFMMNLMLVAFDGWTPEQVASALHYRYLQKRKKNIQRQKNGYAMRTNKCPGCSRALDDTYVSCKIVSREDDDGEEVFCTVERKSFPIGI